MTNLFRLQFRRLFKSKSFYILLAISVLAIIISISSIKAISSFYPDITEPTNGLTELKKGFGNGMLSIILGIMVSLFVCEDFMQETIKNIYAKGYSRKDVYIVDYVVTLVETCIIVFLDDIVSLGFGSAFFGLGTAGSNYFLSILATFFMALVYHSIFFATAISIRRNGGSIAICIIGPLVIELILLFIDSLIFKGKNTNASTYWIDGRLTILGAYNVELIEIGITFLVGALYIMAAIFISYLINEKKES